MSTEKCIACRRDIHHLARDRTDIVRYSLHHLPTPGESNRATAATLCGPCAEEMFELTDEFPETDVPRPMEYAAIEEPWEIETCGFCGDHLTDARAFFTYHWHRQDDLPDVWPVTVLCPGCLDVLDTFLRNLPEEMPDGETFYGRFEDDQIKTAVDDADFDTIRERSRELEEGDIVRFEAHRSTDEHHPEEYTEVEGVVYDENMVGGMPCVYIIPRSRDGEYRLLDPLHEDHSLDVRYVGDETTSHGTVTILEHNGSFQELPHVSPLVASQLAYLGYSGFAAIGTASGEKLANQTALDTADAEAVVAAAQERSA